MRHLWVSCWCSALLVNAFSAVDPLISDAWGLRVTHNARMIRMISYAYPSLQRRPRRSISRNYKQHDACFPQTKLQGLGRLLWATHVGTTVATIMQRQFKWHITQVSPCCLPAWTPKPSKIDQTRCSKWLPFLLAVFDQFWSILDPNVGPRNQNAH